MRILANIYMHKIKPRSAASPDILIDSFSMNKTFIFHFYLAIFRARSWGRKFLEKSIPRKKVREDISSVEQHNGNVNKVI